MKLNQILLLSKRKKGQFKHLFRVIKLSFILFIISAHQIFAVNEEPSKIIITVPSTNTTVERIINQIEKQTEYLVVYGNVDVKKKLTLSTKSASLISILDQVKKQTALYYRIDGKYVMLSVNNSFTQEAKKVKITGVVTEESGIPVVGATVLEVGTKSNGAVTDIDGKFSMTVMSTSTIRASCIGFISKGVEVGVQTSINIILNEDEKLLEEVIVVGYGTRKKVNLTGAVESIDITKSKTRAYTNASAMLQGQVAGAFIRQESAQPGHDNAQIQIRGIGTFNNTNPLVIIDGIESSLGAINPKDIESVSVLKDAASCAIYGNRAANGVILVTTKTGTVDKVSIEYSGMYGLQEVTSFPDLLTGVDYLTLKAESEFNSSGVNPPWYTEEYMANYINHVDKYMYPTDYSAFDDVFQVASVTDHYLSITGGSKNFKYATSMGYLVQDGIIKGNSSDKFTFRGNASASFLDNKLQVTANISTQYKIIDDLVNGAGDMLYFAFIGAPIYRIELPGVGYQGGGYNLGARDAGGFNRSKDTPIDLNASIAFEPIKNLKISVSGAMNRSFNETKVFKPTVQMFGLNSDGSLSLPNPAISSLRLSSSQGETYTFNAYVNYDLRLAEKHSFNVMGGYEMREYTHSSNWMSRENLTVNLPEFGVGDPNTQKNGSGASDIAWMSGFGRLGYNFDERYIFDASLRYDGSSRFIDKWGLFPSASFAWRVSQEQFAKDIHWLDNLKLRLSWGRLGNESIGQNYAAADELSLDGSMNFGDQLTGIAAVTKLANKNTTWETTEQYNFGVDFDIFRKVSVSVEYYIKNTYDILMQVPVSSTLGMSTVPYQNAGEMQNKGFEILTRYNDRFGDVGVNISASAAYIKNEVKDLAGRDELLMGNTIWRVGESFNSLYGYHTEGIYQNQKEIDNHLIFDKNGIPLNPYVGLTPVPGDIRLVDKTNIDIDSDGVFDSRNGVIDEDDKDILGQTFPKWTFSANFGIDYRGFDFAMFFQGVAGIKSLNQGYVTAPFYGGGSNIGSWYMDRWTPENPSQTVQRLHQDPVRAELISEYYLEDASYLRCKSIDLGYTIPDHIIRKVVKSDVSIRAYASVQNLFVITGMRYGFDPEKPTTSTNMLQYPQSKIYSFGINLKF